MKGEEGGEGEGGRGGLRPDEEVEDEGCGEEEAGEEEGGHDGVGAAKLVPPKGFVDSARKSSRRSETS